MGVALILALGGLTQLIRTVRVVVTGPAMESGEIVVFCADNTLRQLPLNGAFTNATSEPWNCSSEGKKAVVNYADRSPASGAGARNG